MFLGLQYARITLKTAMILMFTTRADNLICILRNSGSQRMGISGLQQRRLTHFLLILYPFRKFSTPKITSNFIAQTYLEIGRAFFNWLPHLCAYLLPPSSRKSLPSRMKLIYPVHENYYLRAT